MSGRGRVFALSVVSAVTLYLVLGAGLAFAEPPDLLGGSSSPDARVGGLRGEADEPCDKLDDTTDEDTCDEVNNETEESKGEGNKEADDTCDAVDDTTDEDTCDDVDTSMEEGDQQGGPTSQTTSNQTTNTGASNQTTNTGASNQTTHNENANNQSTNNPATNNPNTDGPIARAGRWVVHLTDRLGDVIGSLVGRLADLLGGGDATKASNRNPNANSEHAAGSDRSGESASATSAGNPEEEGEPPPPWWEAWLPFTGSQWLLLAAAAALVLIGVGVALRSMGRRRRVPSVKV